MRVIKNRVCALLAALSLIAGVSILVVPPALAGVVVNVPASH